ncbi:MAG: hypothetical protein IPN19_05530 [Elusimicrobia bacterium]|nr:hypothetical protein [Elusimicrobiota bacterium]
MSSKRNGLYGKCRTSWVGIGRFILSVVYLVSQTMISSAESNFWSERRAATRQHRERTNPKGTGLLVSLPAGTSPYGHALSLQSIVPLSLQTLSSSGRKNYSDEFLSKHEILLNAMPLTWGSVRKVIQPPAGQRTSRLVVHIQDVHHNEDAQRNIGHVVQSLVEKDQVALIALEGAFTPISLEGLRGFARPDILHPVADYLLRVHEVSGPIFSALTSTMVFPPMVGIDDRDHYRSNVEAYQRAAPRVKEYQEKLVRLRSQLDRQLETELNPTLLSFVREVCSFHRDQTSLGNHLKSIIQLRPRVPFGPSVKAFREALSLETELDYKEVERQRTELIQSLARKLDDSQIRNLAKKSEAYRLGQTRYTEFYRDLQILCQNYGVGLERYPAMKNYIRYILLADQIDPESLFTELAATEDALLADLSKTVGEKRRVNEALALTLVEKLVDFSLTPSDWSKYESLKKVISSPAVLDLTDFESFYHEAQARDDAMAKNLIQTMDTAKTETAVLVTGGFHANGLAENLKKAGITIISFIPKIEKIETEQGSAYLSVFSQEKTALENLFKGQKLFLATNPADMGKLPFLAATGAVADAQAGRQGKGSLPEIFSGIYVELARRLGFPNIEAFLPSLEVEKSPDGDVEVIVKWKGTNYKVAYTGKVIAGFGAVTTRTTGKAGTVSKALLDWGSSILGKLFYFSDRAYQFTLQRARDENTLPLIPVLSQETYRKQMGRESLYFFSSVVGLLFGHIVGLQLGLVAGPLFHAEILGGLIFLLSGTSLLLKQHGEEARRALEILGIRRSQQEYRGDVALVLFGSALSVLSLFSALTLGFGSFPLTTDGLIERLAIAGVSVLLTGFVVHPILNHLMISHRRAPGTSKIVVVPDPERGKDANGKHLPNEKNQNSLQEWSGPTQTREELKSHLLAVEMNERARNDTVIRFIDEKNRMGMIFEHYGYNLFTRISYGVIVEYDTQGMGVRVATVRNGEETISFDRTKTPQHFVRGIWVTNPRDGIFVQVFIGEGESVPDLLPAPRRDASTQAVVLERAPPPVHGNKLPFWLRDISNLFCYFKESVNYRGHRVIVADSPGRGGMDSDYVRLEIDLDEADHVKYFRFSKARVGYSGHDEHNLFYEKGEGVSDILAVVLREDHRESDRPYLMKYTLIVPDHRAKYLRSVWPGERIVGVSQWNNENPTRPIPIPFDSVIEMNEGGANITEENGALAVREIEEPVWSVEQFVRLYYPGLAQLIQYLHEGDIKSFRRVYENFLKMCEDFSNAVDHSSNEAIEDSFTKLWSRGFFNGLSDLIHPTLKLGLSMGISVKQLLPLIRNEWRGTGRTTLNLSEKISEIETLSWLRRELGPEAGIIKNMNVLPMHLGKRLPLDEAEADPQNALEVLSQAWLVGSIALSNPQKGRIFLNIPEEASNAVGYCTVAHEWGHYLAGRYISGIPESEEILPHAFEILWVLDSFGSSGVDFEKEVAALENDPFQIGEKTPIRDLINAGRRFARSLPVGGLVIKNWGVMRSKLNGIASATLREAGLNTHNEDQEALERCQGFVLAGMLDELHNQDNSLSRLQWLRSMMPAPPLAQTALTKSVWRFVPSESKRMEFIFTAIWEFALHWAAPYFAVSWMFGHVGMSIPDMWLIMALTVVILKDVFVGSHAFSAQGKDLSNLALFLAVLYGSGAFFILSGGWGIVVGGVLVVVGLLKHYFHDISRVPPSSEAALREILDLPAPIDIQLRSATARYRFISSLNDVSLRGPSAVTSKNSLLSLLDAYAKAGDGWEGDLRQSVQEDNAGLWVVPVGANRKSLGAFVRTCLSERRPETEVRFIAENEVVAFALRRWSAGRSRVQVRTVPNAFSPGSGNRQIFRLLATEKALARDASLRSGLAWRIVAPESLALDYAGLSEDSPLWNAAVVFLDELLRSLPIPASQLRDLHDTAARLAEKMA